MTMVGRWLIRAALVVEVVAATTVILTAILFVTGASSALNRIALRIIVISVLAGAGAVIVERWLRKRART